MTTKFFVVMECAEALGVFEACRDGLGTIKKLSDKPVIVGNSIKELNQEIAKLSAAVTLAREYPSMMLRKPDDV